VTEFFKAARLAAEYSEAFVAAMRAAENGMPLVEVLREFARGTAGELDDHAVDTLVAGIDETLSALNSAVMWAGSVALWLEVSAPKAIGGLSTIGTKLLALSIRLQSLKK
jgi:hypothetical protein